MRICVIGSGGREHAVLWSLEKEKKHKLFAVGGNGGTAGIAEHIDVNLGDVSAAADVLSEKRIEMAVIGPEQPLVDGLADILIKKGIKVLGPPAAGARIEGSKVWAKEFMVRHGIPTAAYEIFDDFEKATAYVESLDRFPVVIKADGLAAGKGVIIAEDKGDAREALLEIMVEKKFGSAGNLVEIEEYLEGVETSYLVFTDGITYRPMATSKDHKKIYEKEEGPNTGGMGTLSPSPVMSGEVEDIVRKEVIEKAIEGFRKEGVDYRGVLYAGIMITKEGPKVLEFNCRFGDPETQVILARLATPLSEISDAVSAGMLDKINLRWRPESAVCVIAASGGYPGTYVKGKLIRGLDRVRDAVVFHAGTKSVDGHLYTSGGRVLGVTALGRDIRSAAEKAYEEMEKITFEGMYFRRDIGMME